MRVECVKHVALASISRFGLLLSFAACGSRTELLLTQADASAMRDSGSDVGLSDGGASFDVANLGDGGALTCEQAANRRVALGANTWCQHHRSIQRSHHHASPYLSQMTDATQFKSRSTVPVCRTTQPSSDALQRRRLHQPVGRLFHQPVSRPERSLFCLSSRIQARITTGHLRARSRRRFPKSTVPR
jgi:hypothetical protein